MFQDLGRLSNHELLARVESLALEQRRLSAALVAHLAEMEARKLYLDLGYSSLFAYCTQALHFSEHAAYSRIEAARAARRVPAVLAWLERGDLHLTGVKLLASVLTPETHEEILSAAKHKSRREIEELVASLRPQPDVPDRVRAVKAGAVRGAGCVAEVGQLSGAARQSGARDAGALAQPASDRMASGLPLRQTEGASVTPEKNSAFVTGMNTEAADLGLVPGRVPGSRSESAAPNRRPAAVVVPLAPARFKIQFTASGATHDKLLRAQELLRHRIPNGDLDQVFDLALQCLVQELEKKKTAATTRPRRAAPAGPRVAGAASAASEAAARAGSVAAAPAPDVAATPSRQASRYIPAAVRREVWQRDGGRCTFVGSNGARCTERGWIEFDHRWPHGDGGQATVDNMRLLCRGHNQLEARRFFGMWVAEREAKVGDGQASNREAVLEVRPRARLDSSRDEFEAETRGRSS